VNKFKYALILRDGNIGEWTANVLVAIYIIIQAGDQEGRKRQAF
jgi:hypothetical protein